MAIKRKDIRAILENDEMSADDRVKRIMDIIHEETDVLRDHADSIQQELDKANADLEAAQGTISEKEQALTDANNNFENYKIQQAEEQTATKKAKAYRELLKNANIGENRIDAIMKVTDLTDIKLNQDGSIRDSEKVTDGIKEAWKEFIPVTQTQNSDVAVPPTSVSGEKTWTKEEIMAIKDRSERRKAIAENAELFRG